MEVSYTDFSIKFEKELNMLDKFVIDFVSVLNESGMKYVIVSGYVAILFGRNRASEDVDLFLEKIGFDEFKILWSKIVNKFDCLNTTDVKVAYEDFLLDGIALRFSYKNKFIPNMELKFPKNEVDIWTLENKRKVILNKNVIYISPLELQIPFKLTLGSGKDIEDAKYLYELFKNRLNMRLLNDFIRKFKVGERFNIIQ